MYEVFCSNAPQEERASAKGLTQRPHIGLTNSVDRQNQNHAAIRFNPETADVVCGSVGLVLPNSG